MNTETLVLVIVVVLALVLGIGVVIWSLYDTRRKYYEAFLERRRERGR